MSQIYARKSNIYDPFDGTYNLTADAQLSPSGKWRRQYVGQNPQNGAEVGLMGVRVPAGGAFPRVFYEYPYTTTNTDPDLTSASNVKSDLPYFTDFDVTLWMRTVAQLRSVPHSWECAWFFFRLNEAEGINFHHYYVAIKTSGFEFGRKDRSDQVDAQCFLFTDSVAHTVGTWYKVRIRAVQNRFIVWENDVQKFNILDDGSLSDFQGPIPAPSAFMYSGKFGMYNEDAEVEFSPLVFNDMPTAAYMTTGR